MSTIITTRHERRVEADPSGMTVTDTTDGQSIMVALTRAQAGELAAALVPERDFSGVDWRAMFVSAAGERDAAVARAEKAAQLIPAYAMLDIWMAIGRDSIHFDDWYDEHGYADAWAELTAAVREGRGDLDAARENAEHYQAMFDATERQRDEWKSRAEAAEARYGSERLRWERARDHHADESRKWGEKRRWYEARIAELEAAEARTAPEVSYGHLHQEVVAAYEYGRNPTERIEFIVKYMCHLFGVEAEPADPVTEKARELAGVMHEAIKDERIEWHTAPAAVDAMAARLAAHLLGQEANDE